MTVAWHPGENTDKHDAPPYQPTTQYSPLEFNQAESEHYITLYPTLDHCFRLINSQLYDNPDDWHSNIVSSLCLQENKRGLEDASHVNNI